jgi:hypothetical protein
MEKFIEKTLFHKIENHCEIINIIFWSLFVIKNNLKFIVAFFLTFQTIKNIYIPLILLIFPSIKFIYIGIKNFEKFKQTPLKARNFQIAIIIISK